MTRKIHILDTTLRDGEQAPGASMDPDGKLAIVHQLLRLKVDVIEAGFPASSPGDFKAVRDIAAAIQDQAVTCALARAVDSDVETAADALKYAQRPRIHTGLGVSPLHLKDKLRMTEDEALDRAVSVVKLARNLVDDVQFYAEDAGRADLGYLCKVVQAVIKAGATVVNIPDTTGFCLPEDFGNRISYLMENVEGIEDVTVSVHCHDDLGMATALSLAGIAHGATQVECTMNGIGERAGNTPLEEVVMAIYLHGDELDAHTDIETTALKAASHTVSRISGFSVPRNKAIVGNNAFRHSSGIHQDGVLKNPATYEILDPALIGAEERIISLSARSGRAALRARLEALGYDLEEDVLQTIYDAFLQMADRKKEVYDEDLQILVAEYGRADAEVYSLSSVQVSCGYPLTPTATVWLRDPKGEEQVATVIGEGPVDAVYKAINQIVQAEADLTEFSIQSLTRGIDAIGKVTVRITDPQGIVYVGRGADGDIITASAKAYLNALNRMLADEDKGQ